MVPQSEIENRYVHTSTRGAIRTHVHTYIYTYRHIHMYTQCYLSNPYSLERHTYIHTYIQAYTYTPIPSHSQFLSCFEKKQINGHAEDVPHLSGPPSPPPNPAPSLRQLQLPSSSTDLLPHLHPTSTLHSPIATPFLPSLSHSLSHTLTLALACLTLAMHEGLCTTHM